MMAVGPSRVVDLFSGGGGMSCGFYAHPTFELAGAVDVEIGKPSTGHGALGCNATYAENLKITLCRLICLIPLRTRLTKLS